jgi:Protein of unknown function (DUF2891)
VKIRLGDLLRTPPRALLRRRPRLVGVAAIPLLVAACSQWADEKQPTHSSISNSVTREAQRPSPPDMVGGMANVPKTLAAPIAECVGRNDTAHPVFHGCIDWHSAVHGNYSLRVVSRLTGDKEFVDIAQSVISADGLRGELTSVNAGQIGQELPYGFAWLLILDREAAFGDMAPLAVAVSSQLRQWITDHVEGSELNSTEYQNLSFAVFALHRWYLRFAPKEAATLRRTVVSTLAKRWREPCSQESRQIAGFFDPCANLLLALSDSHAADPGIVDDADLASILDAVIAVPPLAPQDLLGVHTAGLNFSRSWAIYVTAVALGRKQLLEVADEYFLATFNAPELWRENYHCYSHWVAQFGVHALDLRDQAQQRLLRRP